MITAQDAPIIRRALTRRLEGMAGIKILEILVADRQHFVRVGVLLHIDDKILLKSVFDLEQKGTAFDGVPAYELKDVHNQADEIAEACKEARHTLRFTG